MTQIDSDEDIEQLTNHETSLEAAAKARKRRLLAMKSKIHGIAMEEEDYDQEETSTKKSKEVEQSKEFRNHRPDTSVGTQKAALDLEIVQREIADHLQDVLHEKPVDTVDLAMLAPKKIDWDLKRDVEAKMSKLERRTQRAVATIIRQRLAEGKGDLAATVAAASADL